MPDKFNEEASAQLKFGGGVHSRASEDDIEIRECSLGENFELDPQNQDFRPRGAFDLIGQVPNEAEIRGFATLQKSNGDVSFLVQAGDTVYEWDGGSNFTSRGTVSSQARLRGRIEHIWQLDDKVIITDLELQEDVLEWDGSTLSTVSFTDENDSAFGDFRAKYCYVSKERAVFGNIYENGNTFPHLFVGAKRSDYTQITVSDRPSSSLSPEDPFFLVEPDLRPINGVIESFGRVITSSEAGSLYSLEGESAEDFSLNELFPRSGATGDEALVWAGNDILYGRQGRIASVTATERFGDVASASISDEISDQLREFGEWTAVYNSRNNRAYFFPVDQSQVWVYFKDVATRGVLQEALSPWVKWTTKHTSSFNPTAVMNALDPSDGLEYVFFGDADGNLYRMEGSRETGDAGTADIRAFRLSRLINVPLDAQAYEIQGYVRWRRDAAHTLTLRMEYAGENVFNKSISLDLPADVGAIYYGGGVYYSNGEYYGTLFKGRLTRKLFSVSGSSNEFQVRLQIEGDTAFAISEVGFRLIASS